MAAGIGSELYRGILFWQGPLSMEMVGRFKYVVQELTEKLILKQS